MKYSEKTFFEKIKSADATIELLDFYFEDELGYKNEGTDCYIKLNGFFHVEEFENDLHKSYNEFINDLISKINKYKLREEKIKLIFSLHTEIHDIRNLLFVRRQDIQDYYAHKNFNWKNESAQEKYLDRTLSEAELQEFYFHTNNYINVAIEKIQLVLDMVKAEGEKISILTLEQLTKEPKKIKLNISNDDFCALIRLMIEAGIIDSNASTELAKTIARSFDTKRTDGNLSEKSVRNKISDPELKFIDSAKDLTIKMMNCAIVFDK